MILLLTSVLYRKLPSWITRIEERLPQSVILLFVGKEAVGLKSKEYENMSISCFKDNKNLASKNFHLEFKLI